MLYLVGPLIESRLGDHLFDTRFVVLVSFSMQMAGHVPKWHFMWLANTEFCRYLSIIMEVTYINLFIPVSQTADFTARIYIEFSNA